MTSRTSHKATLLILAVIAYVPLLLTRHGEVVADTKQYLTLDPGGVLDASRSLWDPDWALGTVTHQSIGYLWPLGPFFWLGEVVGLPDWVTQRLWIATILFVAGAGMVWLSRVLMWDAPGVLVAAMLYQLSPYPLSYVTRISVLILPWAALPWMIGLAVLALRKGGWRHPALIALIATTVGSVNASSLFYAGLGVILWFPFAVFVHRDATVGRAVATMARIGGLTLAASAWWSIPLLVQARWGPPVLQFSETLEVVASGSTSIEAWRGLGYWIFYGGDKTGPWVGAAVDYTQQLWLLAAGFSITGLIVTAVFVVRWRYRAYLLALMALGLLLTIGLHPFDDPSPIGEVVGEQAGTSTLGLALRSSPRALPLFLLGASVLVGVATSAMARRLTPRRSTALVAAILVLVVANQPQLFTGKYIGEELARDESVPSYWQDAAAYLDQSGTESRALILPGGDFSAHRWGNTIDHILPGLIDRPVAIRELIGFSTEPANDLFIAVDRRWQERVNDPDSLAATTRLLGSGSVVFQLDLEYERYRTPRPRELWDQISAGPDGFEAPVAFGAPTANRAGPEFPLLDEIELGLAADLADGPPVAVLDLVEAGSIVATHSAARPLVVAGSGEGLVDLAEAGRLDSARTILYSADLTDSELADAVSRGATLVLTDSNRARARRWKSVRDNVGFTERADGIDRIDDSTDARLVVFSDPAAGSSTTARQQGGAVWATGYGNPISYHPEDRPVRAIDGDILTAWRVAAFSDARGHAITVRPDTPESVDQIVVIQPVNGSPDRFITDLLVYVNGAEPLALTLDERSLASPGQTIGLPATSGPVREITLEIVETSAGRRPGFGGLSPVGFAEISIGSTVVDETIVVPTDLLSRVSPANAAELDMLIELSRLRTDPGNAVRNDTEIHLDRVFSLPAARVFEVGGTARLSPRASGERIDAELGVAPASSSGHLPGRPHTRASAAIDSNPATAWITPFGRQVGHWIEFDLPDPSNEPVRVTFLADNRHSIPTSIRTDNNGVTAFHDVGANGVVDIAGLGVGNTRLTIEAVEARITTDWFSEGDITMPIGLSEIATGASPSAPALNQDCRSDLLTIDGQPVSVRIVGTPDPAAAVGIDIVGCETIDLGPGEHRVETAIGRDHGIDIDQLLLDSSGTASTTTAAATSQPVTVVNRDRGSYTLSLEPGDEPFWLVLAESFSAGWEAEVTGMGNIGPSRLVDGFANGWLIDPGRIDADGPIEVNLRWAPGRDVRLGLYAGLAAVIACIGLALRPPAGRAQSVTAVEYSVVIPGLASTDRKFAMTTAIGLGVGTGIAVGGLTRPGIGVLVAIATFAASARPKTKILITLGALGSLGAAGAYVLVQTFRFDLRHGGDWPGLFTQSHLLGWLTLGLLMAELVISAASTARDP